GALKGSSQGKVASQLASVKTMIKQYTVAAATKFSTGSGNFGVDGLGNSVAQSSSNLGDSTAQTSAQSSTRQSDGNVGDSTAQTSA
ncbi:hypothetical protein PF004_g30600, partial [Phytophthora fragariae]